MAKDALRARGAAGYPTGLFGARKYDAIDDIPPDKIRLGRPKTGGQIKMPRPFGPDGKKNKDARVDEPTPFMAVFEYRTTCRVDSVTLGWFVRPRAGEERWKRDDTVAGVDRATVRVDDPSGKSGRAAAIDTPTLGKWKKLKSLVVVLTSCALPQPDSEARIGRLVLNDVGSFGIALRRISAIPPANSGDAPVALDILLPSVSEAHGDRPWPQEYEVVMNALRDKGYTLPDVSIFSRGGMPFGSARVWRLLGDKVEIATISPDNAGVASKALWQNRIPHGWSFGMGFSLYVPRRLQDGAMAVLRVAKVKQTNDEENQDPH